MQGKHKMTTFKLYNKKQLNKSTHNKLTQLIYKI